jgi:hypothetical protein
MFANMREKTYTARQLAERYSVAGSTVRGWLLRRLMPGAYLQKTELGDSYWLVPESALKDFVPPKPGPVPKPKGNGEAKPKRAAKKGGKK